MRDILKTLSGIILLLASVSAGASDDAVVGHDGTLYQVRTGLYADLFPQGTETDGTDSVLALDATTSDGETARRLVAASTGPEVEELAALVFEDQSETLYLAWERIQGETSQFILAGFQDGGWLPAIDVAQNVDPRPGSLRIGVTRDTYLRVAQGGPNQEVERTILHLSWWDQTDERVLYAPIVLLDGQFLGWAPIVDLNALDPYDGTETVQVGEESRVPTMEAGSDTSAVVIAFTNASSGRLLSVEARALPGELGRVAREVADLVVDHGVGTLNIEDIGDLARSHIVEFSTDMHPAYRDYLGKQVQDRWLELIYNPETPGVVAQRLAAQLHRDIVNLGSTFYGVSGRSRFFDPQRLRFVEVYSEPPAADELPAEMAHLIRLYLVRERVTPVAGGERAVVMVSEDGDDSLVCWEGEDTLRYQESTGAGWSETRTLTLGDGVDQQLGRKVLRERIRNH